MNNRKSRFYLLFAITFFTTAATTAQTPARFAGLHFDFHASLNDSAIGKTFTAGMIDSLMTIVQPDFIQVDCKGHPGISSYPTAVGNGPYKPEKDILKIWREVTARHHVPLFVHYSGILDRQAIAVHPAWGRVSAGGKHDDQAVSVLSGYEDSLLIPQFRELATKYQVDGAWVDGDCWALHPDYGAAARAEFLRQTGFDSVPVKKTDPHFYEWMTFNRKLFRDYMAKYVNAIHQIKPGFRITSNWSFSSMMPEKVDVPVDFLSGDVAGENSLYSAAFESRCLALQGKPWDLMSWSFAMVSNVKVTKPMVQLRQEAAEVLAMGGGYQTYWTQNRDGSPELQYYRLMADIVAFTKAYRPYTFGGEVVPQIGLLYSTYSWKRVPTTDLYSSSHLNALKENLNCLLNSQYSVDIVMDHQLKDRLGKYPLMIVPEWTDIDPQVRKQLIDYVTAGGKLIITGAAAVRDFSDELGIQLAGPVQEDTTFYASLNGTISGQLTDFQPVSLREGTEGIGRQSRADDLRFLTPMPLAVYRPLGKGMIAGVLLDVGGSYGRRKSPFLPKLMQEVISNMQAPLMSSVTGSGYVHQLLTRKDGLLYVHLINAGGPHDNPHVETYDELSPLRSLQVQLSLAKAPKAVVLQPGNRKLSFRYDHSKAIIGIPEVKDYSIIQVTE